MKTWIAINLRDFHNPDKKWQRGNKTSIEAMVIGAKSLEKAKLTAKIGNKDAWLIAPLHSTKNIAYAD